MVDQKQTNNYSISYRVPIEVSESYHDGKSEFLIQGVAINATITDNKHVFLAEELEIAATSLKGVPLLKDHNNMVDSIVGSVVDAFYDGAKENIRFKARINDTDQGKKVKELIKAGDLSTVSIGANVSELDEGEDGFIPRGIIFKELSLVAVPADEDATFTFVGQSFEAALQEAWKFSHSSSKASDNNKIERRIEMEKDKAKIVETSEEETTKEEAVETVEAETNEELEEVKASVSKLDAKVDSQTKIISEVLAGIAKLQEADADETPVEEPKEEAVEPVEPKEEPAVEEPAEEAEPEEDDDDEESVDEKSGYKIVQDNRSFTILRNKY